MEKAGRRAVSMPDELMEMALTPIWAWGGPDEDEDGNVGPAGAASVERWAASCAVTAAKVCGAASTGEAYGLYRSWAQGRGIEPAGKTAFSRTLRRMLGLETYTAREGGRMVRKYREAGA